NDGKYLISAFIPISTTALPATAADVTKAERDAMKKDYKGYIASIVNTLDSAPQSVTPSLAALDAMMTSMFVSEPLFPKAAPTPTRQAQTATGTFTGKATELLNVRAGP